MAIHEKVTSIDPVRLCIFRPKSLSQCYGKEKGNYVTVKKTRILPWSYAPSSVWEQFGGLTLFRPGRPSHKLIISISIRWLRFA